VKTLKDITDEMIIDAVASFGFRGVPSKQEFAGDIGSGLADLARRLQLVPTDVSLWEHDGGDAIAGALYERMRHLPAKIITDSTGWLLTPEAWARRLVGLDMIQIATALRGLGEAAQPSGAAHG